MDFLNRPSKHTKYLERLIPRKAIKRDRNGTPVSNFRICPGVTNHIGRTYSREHLYYSDRLSVVGSYRPCLTCLDLRKELKKYRVIE